MERLQEVKRGAGKILALLRKAMCGEIWMAAETLAAALFFLFGQEVAGVVAFVYLIAFKLILSDDSLCGFLPFLLIGLMVLRLYDSYDRFMALRFVMGVPAVFGVLFHFIFYRKAPHRGGLTKGYLAISFALALGGLFSLSARDYFSGTSLYYVYGLGFGMLLLYSLLLKGVNPREEYDIRDFIAKTAFYCGIFSIFIIAVQYLGNLHEIKAGWTFSVERLSSISNNLSTTVLMTMPFAFYLSRKGGARGVVSFIVGVLEGIAAVMSLSRGGAIFATSMCVYLIGYTLWTDKKGRTRNLVTLAGVGAVVATVFFIFRNQLTTLFHEGIVETSTKTKLIYFALAGTAIAVTAYGYCLFRTPNKRKRRAQLAILFSLATVALAIFVVKFDSLKEALIRMDYYRGNMMIIAAKNFKTYPFFGTGIGYRGLRAVYENKQGMFGCYHCFPVQVVGSMGLFGVAAYLYMFRERTVLLFRAPSKAFSAAVFFSYLGLLWISLVEPGIFCPVVYGLQLAIYFIAAERAETSLKNPEK